MKNSKRIFLAIKTTKVFSKVGTIPPQYFEKTLASRQPDGVGSIFNKVITEDDIINANWADYHHPNLMFGCTAFRSSIPGRLGVVRLKDLNPSIMVSLVDPKETGQVSAVIKTSAQIVAPDVDFTVVILGKEGGQEIVFTLHPGDPILPSEVSSKLAGKTISISEAIALGLEWASLNH